MSNSTMHDPRLSAPHWDPSVTSNRPLVRGTILINLLLGVWYLGWLLEPGRAGNPVLYVALIAAEAFNLVQALGFWWTIWSDSRPRAAPAWCGPLAEVDVFIPVYNEPLDVVEATVRAAVALRGAYVNVYVLDDGADEKMRRLAERYGATYVRRPTRGGAKAGNINYALGITTAPYIAIFDCDHVPRPEFLEATLGHFADDKVAFVQTPQYYANLTDGGVAAASAAQQSLFFGVIARSKAAHGSMFCCGTNVVLRRTALAEVGGFPEDSLTEDFALSVGLHERGWRSEYVAQVLASGLGPEDVSSYVSQQRRWAQGNLSGMSMVLRSRLPWRTKLQYLSSSTYYLSGWSLLMYMALPIVKLTTGLQPISATGADQFLLHFAPYFAGCIAIVTFASGGAYTFSAFALSTATFGVHLRATIVTLAGRRGRFIVTPKHGGTRRQLRPVAGALVAVILLAAAIAEGLSVSHGPGTINNAAYAAVHIAVLLVGAWPALRGTRRVLDLTDTGPTSSVVALPRRRVAAVGEPAGDAKTVGALTR